MQRQKQLVTLVAAISTLVAEARPVLRRAAATEGSHVGTGGDALRCRPPSPGSRSPFSGLYSLDYVLTFEKGNADIPRVASLRDSFARIARVLAGLPTLAKSFDHFVRTYKQSNPMTGKKWEPAFDLKDIPDERMVALVPENCRDGDKVNLIQAVVRQYESFSGGRELVVYKYNEPLFRELEALPLQLSFLLVHEWLWDLSWNVDRNRRVNRFLHSREAERLAPAELRAHLEKLGLSIPGETPPVFEEAICPAQVDGRPLEAPLEDFLAANAGQRRIPFSRFGFFARRKHCEDARCTSDWIVENPDPLLVGAYPTVLLESFDDREVFLELSSEGGVPQLECRVVRATGVARCGALRTAKGLPYSLNSQRYSYTGILTSECLRLTAFLDVRVSSTNSIRKQTVIYGKRPRR